MQKTYTKNAINECSLKAVGWVGGVSVVGGTVMFYPRSKSVFYILVANPMSPQNGTEIYISFQLNASFEAIKLSNYLLYFHSIWQKKEI